MTTKKEIEEKIEALEERVKRLELALEECQQNNLRYHQELDSKTQSLIVYGSSKI